MAYFVTLLNGTVPFTAFTKYSPHGEEVERKSFLFPTLTQAPPPLSPENLHAEHELKYHLLT